MAPKTLAHLSDLHLGSSREAETIVRRLSDSLLDAEVDHVVVTGDITHRGRRQDLTAFFEIFRPFHRTGRLTVVPGNHDRNGEDAGSVLMKRQVIVEETPGLFIIRIDTTGPHNRSVIASHGQLDEGVLDAVSEALELATPGALTVVLLHHHLLRMPEETVGEWLASKLGWPHADELPLGTALIERLSGRADLVLHGHRHVPSELKVDGTKPLGIYNAGSSTELQRVRIFRHLNGSLVRAPVWHAAPQVLPLMTARATVAVRPGAVRA